MFPLPDEHLIRLYHEIPPSHRGKLDPAQLDRIRDAVDEG